MRGNPTWKFLGSKQNSYGYASCVLRIWEYSFPNTRGEANLVFGNGFAYGYPLQDTYPEERNGISLKGKLTMLRNFENGRTISFGASQVSSYTYLR